MEIINDTINKDFLIFLENKFKNPSKFVYIGCDYYNKDGELSYSDMDLNNFKATNFSSKDSENSIINSQTIANYFIDNNFPNIIYLNKLDILENLFEKYSYFYCYFQRCFNTFVINFLISLDKKRIKDAFTDSYKDFKNRLREIVEIDENISKDINI